VADLNFGDGSWEDARGLVQNTLQELVGLLKGNGKDGMLLTLSNFIVEYRADKRKDKEFRDLRDAEIKAALEASNQLINQNIAKNSVGIAEAGLEVAKSSEEVARQSLVWTIAGVCLAAAGVSATILFGALTWYITKHAGIEPINLFSTVRVVAQAWQSADGFPVVITR
jgi:hypothetical protein